MTLAALTDSPSRSDSGPKNDTGFGPTQLQELAQYLRRSAAKSKAESYTSEALNDPAWLRGLASGFELSATWLERIIRPL